MKMERDWMKTKFSNFLVNNSHITYFFLVKFDKLVENMEKSVEIKQSEYNFLLESKDQEIKFLQEEILKINENIEIIKRDRIRDQKILSDYESEINFLSSRVMELNDKSIENRSVEPSNNENIILEVRNY